MAKKVVAKLKDTKKLKFSKVIIPLKSKKTLAYTFKEKIVLEDKVKDLISQC